MLSPTTLFTVATALAASVNGLAIRDQPSSDKFLRFDLKKVASTQPALGGTLPEKDQFRSGPVRTNIYGKKSNYQIEIGLGSEGNKQSYLIDTGSADFWTVSDNIGDYENYWQSTGEPFEIIYGDNSEISGTFGTGSVFVGSTEVKNLKYAISDTASGTANDLNGILGVGPVTSESSGPYDNLPILLKQQGFIDSNSYSYYLNKADTDQGVFIFGGKDTAKVDGKTVTLTKSGPLGGDHDGIILGKLATEGGLFEDLDAVFDTGTTLGTLTKERIDGLNIEELYVINDSNGSPVYLIDCDAPLDKFVTFTFGDLDVQISLKDLSVPGLISGGGYGGACLFGLQPYPKDLTIFGDVILRHLYITVDHDRQTIDVSKVKYTDEENIVAI